MRKFYRSLKYDRLYKEYCWIPPISSWNKFSPGIFYGHWFTKNIITRVVLYIVLI